MYGGASVVKRCLFFRLIPILALILFISCCSFSPKKAKDCDIIPDFQPLEWSENYVFGATQYPPRISVWNSQNGKLIQQYNFYTADKADDFFENAGKWLRVHTMDIVDKNIWCITFGNQCSLVKIDVQTGNVKFIDLEEQYEYLEYIPDVNDGKGGLLVVPFAQYMQDFKLKLFDLDGNLIKLIKIKAADIDILTAKGQFKNGYYYFCAATHEHIQSGEEPFDAYKIIKIDFETRNYEVIPLSAEKLMGKNFIKNNMPEICKEYTTSFSVKSEKTSDESYLIAVDFIGFDNHLNDYDAGRFLFETKDFASDNFVYTDKNIISSKDNVDIFPRIYNKTDNYYSMIGNDGDNLYAVFYNDSGKDYVYMPYGETIFMDVTENIIWCSKNSYYYSEETKKWFFENDGIYKVDLKEKKVTLHLSDGSSRLIPCIR